MSSRYNLRSQNQSPKENTNKLTKKDLAEKIALINDTYVQKNADVGYNFMTGEIEVYDDELSRKSREKKKSTAE